MKDPSFREKSGTHAVPQVDRVLARGGEAGALARSVDWSKTAIGDVPGWSQALRSAAALVLHNEFPMLLWWGPEFVQIYNDAYRPVLGDKHPQAMGQRFSECWSEVFHIVGPMADTPFRGGPASTSDDLLLPIRRKLPREETHFRIAYSPVPDETVQPTAIGGVLATVTETTEQVYGERQLRTLGDLSARSAAEAKTVEQACASAAAALGEDPWDVPFALFYMLDERGERARLAASVGFAGTVSEAVAPALVDLTASSAAGPWPLRGVAVERRNEVFPIPTEVLDGLPRSPWSDAPRTAFVLPLAAPDQAHAYGVLVCGVSPHRLLDAGYRTFFELVAAQVVTAIRNARAFDEERKRAEALAEIDRAKTAFFSNVSHEFRTPLTLMLGPTEELLAGAHEPVLPEQHAQLDIVHRNALRLQKLVNSLLDFARLEAGRIQAAYEPVDLAGLTRDLASAFRSAIERAGLQLRVECEPIAAPVYVDRDMWEKIVLNLLSNALKFTFEGSVELSLRAEGAKAESVALRVRDTGVGVAEEHLPRLFERFYRIDGTRSRTHEGSGIGLALVQELARLHGGSVRAESRLGAGTTITVTIPTGSAHLPQDRIGARPSKTPSPPGAAPFVEEALRWLPEDAAVPASTPRLTESAGAAAPPSKRATILLADDNADMRAYVRRILERNWTVQAVPDGAQALAAARARPPDLVLTDVMMPGLDGFELLRELRKEERTKATPVIMLSARAGEEAKLEGLTAGAEDYLIKPFSARELVARVSMHLELARLRHGVEKERDRLRSLLGQVPAVIHFLRGPDLVFEFVHPLAQQRLGNRQLVGRPLLEALPEFRDQEWPALLRQVFETGEPVRGQERLFQHQDGSGARQRSWWNFAYLPVRGDDGQVEGVMTFDMEVTDQVLARQALEDSEARFRKMADNAPVMVWVTEPNGRCSYLSQTWYRFTGQTEATGLGFGWLSAVHPDDEPQARRTFAEANAKREPFRLDYRLRRSDGEYRWAIDSATPRFGTGGEFLGYVGSVLDITERRIGELALAASEARFRAIFEMAEVSLWEEDCTEVKKRLDAWSAQYGDGLRAFLLDHPELVDEAIAAIEIRDVNPATLRMFGATSKEQLLASLHTVFTPESKGVFVDELVALAEGRAVISMESVTQTLVGQRLDVLLSVGFSEREGGRWTAFVTIMDISAQKLAQREREARLAEVEHALTFSETFVGILGHDLRTPLGAIVAASSILLKMESNERILRPIQRIRNSADRMTRMIEQILDFTRARIGGGIPIEPRAADLHTLAAQLVEELEGAAPAAIELRETGATRGEWDADRLGQVLSNLIGNAIEHGSPNEPIRIDIDGSAPASVRLEIWNGGAIPEALQRTLFDPFRRATGSRKAEKSAGLGLGLYIVQQVVLAHGGTLELRSTEAEGTRFTVTLPRRAPRSKRDEA